MSKSASAFPTKETLIGDIQALQRKHTGTAITRNFYRANGTFSESLWQTFFPKFNDFLTAAGLERSTEPETDEIAGNTRSISLPKTRIHTLPELLEYCKVDLREWEVDKFIVNRWEMNAGGGAVEPLYQVKAFLKKRSEMIFIRSEIEELKRDAKVAARVPRPFERRAIPTGNMLEINIPDAHFGKLAWPTETGHEPYDTQITEFIFNRALDNILMRVKGYDFDEVVFVVGNDLFNSDDIEGRTTKGTQVTTDGRYHKTFRVVRRVITAAIERLRKIAPVRVMMVSGNHDNLSVWHLGDSLECYFDKYTDVVIDNTPRARKYHQFGKVMLMWTHGDKGKKDDYPLVMATEQPAMFGATKFRECHCGHTHETKLNERHGVRVRVLPALCPPDDWHSENGYVGNQRNAEGMVWNKDEGLICTVYHNDDAMPVVETRPVVEMRSA